MLGTSQHGPSRWIPCKNISRDFVKRHRRHMANEDGKAALLKLEKAFGIAVGCAVSRVSVSVSTSAAAATITEGFTSSAPTVATTAAAVTTASVEARNSTLHQPVAPPALLGLSIPGKRRYRGKDRRPRTNQCANNACNDPRCLGWHRRHRCRTPWFDNINLLNQGEPVPAKPRVRTRQARLLPAQPAQVIESRQQQTSTAPLLLPRQHT